MRLRINESDIFYSEKDHDIAIDFLKQLKDRFEKNLIDETRYKSAIEALDNLVPKKTRRR